MFDAVLGRAAAPRGRLGAGTTLAVAVHAAIITWALATPPPAPPAEDEPEGVTVFLPPPPPPPPPGGGAKPKAKTEKPRPRARPDVVRIPPPDAPPPPVEAEEEEEESDPYGQPGGVPGGVPNGIRGGEVGGTGTVLTPRPPPPAPPPAPPPPARPLPFTSKMERPVLISGAQPAYTREARTAGVEGLMIVRCVITTSGAARNCMVIKPLPHLTQPVLQALTTHRYRPATLDGRPVDVEYVLNFRFRLED